MEEDVTKTVIKTLKAYLHEELPPNKDFFNKLDCRDLLDSDTALELAQLADQGKKDCIWKLVTFMEQFYTEEKLLRLCIFLEEYAKPARPKLATISSRIRQEISKQKQVSLAVPEDTIHRSARVYDDEEVLFPVITPLKQQFSELVSKVFGIISKLNEEEMEELHTYLTTLLTPSVGQGISDSVRRARLPIVPKPVNELKEFLRLRWDVLHTQVLESIIEHLKNDKLTEMMAHYQQTLSKEANKSLSEHPAERAQTVFPLEETLVQFKLGRNLCELTLAHVSEFCRLICSWITEAVEFRGYKCGCTVLFFSIPTECVRSLPSCLLPSSLSLLEEWKVLFFSVKGAFTVDIKKERHFIDSLDKGKIGDLELTVSTLNEALDIAKLDLKEARIMWYSETAGELRSAKLDILRMSQTLTEQQYEIAQLEQTVSTLEEELDTTKVQVEEARIKDSETAEELRLAKLDNTRMSQTLTERQDKISQLDRVISTLNEELDTAKLELIEARIMWDSETAGELRSAKLDNTRMSQTLTERQDEIAQLEQTVSTLNEQLDTTKVQDEEARIKDSETAEKLRLVKLDHTRMSQTLTERQPGHDNSGFHSLKSINSVVTERNESLHSEVRQLRMSLFDHQQQIACLEENKKRAEEDNRRAVAMMQRTGEEKRKAEETCKEYKRYKYELSAQVGQKMLVGEELIFVKSDLKRRNQDYEEKCQELKKCRDDLGAKAAQYTFLEQELAEIKRQSRKR